MWKAILVGSMAGLGTVSSAAAENADAKLEAFFKSHLDEIIQLRPLDGDAAG